MAVSLLAHEVSDICLGKPALRSLPVSATVADAISALKRSGDASLSVWSCECADLSLDAALTAKERIGIEDCRCVGKICMVDVICYLCKEENRKSPAASLQSPISHILPEGSAALIGHLHPDSSLLEAIDLILGGVQNLVVPIQTRNSQLQSRRKLINTPLLDSTLHKGEEYCWLTQEDVVRFLLNSIGVFSPTPAVSIQTLNIIESVDGLTVRYHEAASSLLPVIARSLMEQTSIAVTDENDRLIGEISPLNISCCDETVMAPLMTLSTGELMAYIDCSRPPDDLVQTVKARLEERNLTGVIELMEEEGLSSVSSFSSSSSSSDEEFGLPKRAKSGRLSSRMVRGTDAIACCPSSSLVAVMIQALAYRVNYVWVVEADYTLAGIVTFSGMLKVLREHIRAMAWK